MQRMETEEIAQELKTAARHGANFNELRDRLDQHRTLGAKDYDQLWFLAWALARKNLKNKIHSKYAGGYEGNGGGAGLFGTPPIGTDMVDGG